MALVHRWKFDEANATDVAVDSVGGVNLTPASGAEPAVVSGYWGKARAFTGTEYLSGAALDHVALLRGDRTFVFWHAFTANHAGQNGGIMFVGQSSVADAFSRQWCRINYLNVAGSGLETYAGGHHTSAGSGTNWVSNLIRPSINTMWVRVALVVSGLDWIVYCNGGPHESGTFPNGPYVPDSVALGNPPAPDVTYVGRIHDGTSVPKYLQGSYLKDLRWYDHAWTADEVGEDFAGGFDSDSDAPTITLVSPADLSTLAGSSTPLVVDVTDEGGLRRAFFNLGFEGWSIRENVHDGTSFADNYSPASTRTTITNGYRYSIVRDGGWLLNPTLDVKAIDQAGNETA